MKTIKVLMGLAIGLLSGQAVAQSGMKGEYYNGTNFEEKVLTRIDPAINFNWFQRSPAPGVGQSYFSVRWTGKLLAPASGKYEFSAQVDDGIRVWVGTKKIIDGWELHDNASFKGSVVLEAGKYYELRVDYFNAMLEGTINLLWEVPDESKSLFGDSFKPIGGQYLFQTIPRAKPVAVKQKQELPPVKVVSQTLKPTPLRKPVQANKPVATTVLPEPTPITTPVVQEKQTESNTFNQLEVGKALILKNVFFEQSKYTLLPESYPELDKLARTMQQNPTIRIEISGHTDNIGDPRLNLSLSEFRARVVMNYLARHGIAENRIETKGYGGTRPLVGNTTESEREQNRRVEFIVKSN
jgi:outer membrane protein OmpA-like peptidoglycan-associated protein